MARTGDRLARIALRGTSNLELVRALRALAPRATLIANAVVDADAYAMIGAGANHVFLWHVETARALLPAIDHALNGELERYLLAQRRRLEGVDEDALEDTAG